MYTQTYTSTVVQEGIYNIIQNGSQDGHQSLHADISSFLHTGDFTQNSILLIKINAENDFFFARAYNPEYPETNPSEQGNRTWATLVVGKCSHHCAIPTSGIIMSKCLISISWVMCNHSSNSYCSGTEIFFFVPCS